MRWPNLVAALTSLEFAVAGAARHLQMPERLPEEIGFVISVALAVQVRRKPAESRFEHKGELALG